MSNEQGQLFTLEQLKQLHSTNFPSITHIDQMRTSIALLNPKVNDVFFEKQNGKYIYFNYRFQAQFVFPDFIDTSSITDEQQLYDALLLNYLYKMSRECRGLCFYENTGTIASRGFHKFFNIGEKKETITDNIDLSKESHVILDKLDGSMVCGILDYLTDDLVQVRFRTKMGFETETATQIQQFIYKVKDPQQYPIYSLKQSKFVSHFENEEMEWKLIHFTLQWLLKGYTPIFEFISPMNQIVLKYSTTQMIVLALRNNITGDYIPYEELKNITKELPIVKAWQVNQQTSIHDIVKQIKLMKDIEGFVIRMEESGVMFKVKCSWYVELHKLSTGNQGDVGVFGRTVSEMYQMVLKNEYDDYVASLEDEEVKLIVDDFATRVWKCIVTATSQVYEKFEALIKENTTIQQFAFAMGKDKELTSLERNILFKIFKTKEVNQSATEKEVKEWIEEEAIKGMLQHLRKEGMHSVPHQVKDYLEKVGNQGNSVEIVDSGFKRVQRNIKAATQEEEEDE